MNTANFNLLDKLIAQWRLNKVLPFVVKGSQVLDFGCGHQHYLLKTIASKIGYGIGLDYDPGQTTQSNLKLILDNFTASLPISSGKLDTIFMLAVLEHLSLEKLDKLLIEFWRVLKFGGQIVMTTPTPSAKSLLEFLAFKAKIISSQEIADHKHYYSKLEIFSLAKKFKFKVVKYSIFQLGLNSIIVLRK